MKRIIFAVLACVPFFSCAEEYIDINDLKARDAEACKGIELKGNYPGILDCVKELSDNSERAMSTRLSEIRAAMKGVGDKEYSAAFEVAQASWEKYKNDQCAYITSGMDKERSGYYFQFHFCNAAENYRRLDTIKGEPSTS